MWCQHVDSGHSGELLYCTYDFHDCEIDSEDGPGMKVQTVYSRFGACNVPGNYISNKSRRTITR